MVTLEEYAALPEYPRYELVAGVLLELPTPEYADHEEAAALACYQLGRHVFPKRLGVVLGSNYGYVTIKEPPSTCRNADVSFISEHRLKIKPDLFGMLYDGAPDLAVEILSRHSVDFEIPRKVTEYLNAGGKAVWVIDIDARTLTVHTAVAPPVTLTDADTVNGGDYLPGFACAVADLLPARAGQTRDARRPSVTPWGSAMVALRLRKSRNRLMDRDTCWAYSAMPGARYRVMSSWLAGS